jgi:branched-chain amino acid transport system ATP-binding protein
MSLLEVNAINTYYGDAHALFDVSLHVEQHEVVALLGRNGAGKSTTMKTIMGVMTPASGSIRFAGQAIESLPPYKIAHLGLQLVPEERRIIGGLTVEENLTLAGLTAPKRWSNERTYEMFPRLAERRHNRGRDLSGGEQQMLAIARAMIAKPKMLLLDEPSEGIMPILVEEMGQLFRALRAQGVTLLLVEQNVEWALNLADRAVIIDQGEIVYESSAAALIADRDIQERYCAV